MCDNIPVEDFLQALKDEPFKFDDILAEYLEVQPSLLLEIPVEELNRIYTNAVNARTSARKQLLSLLSDIWTNAYEDAKPTSTNSLGNLKLLNIGTLYNGIRTAREKYSIVSMLLSFMDYDLVLRFKPEQIFDHSRAEDRNVIKAIEESVQNMPAPDQVRFLDFASDEVKMNQKSCCYHLAHNAVFSVEEPKKITVLVLGEAGAGKSTLVNESFREDLPKEKRCVEGVGEDSITSKIEGKSVIYTRPASEEEINKGMEG